MGRTLYDVPTIKTSIFMVSSGMYGYSNRVLCCLLSFGWCGLHFCFEFTTAAHTETRTHTRTHNSRKKDSFTDNVRGN